MKEVMRGWVFAIIFLSSLLGLSCFKKQDNPVNPPEWPRYKFGGIVVDSVTKEPVEGCIVTIERWQLYFEQDDFSSASDTTDSDGIFLVDSVAPGLVYIDFEKEGYCPYRDSITVWLPPYDSLNYGRYALVKIGDQPQIALYPYRGIGITIWAGTDTNLIQNICNQGHGLPLVWKLSWEKTVDWVSASPMSGTTPPGKCQQVVVHFDATSIFERKVLMNTLIVKHNDPDTSTIYLIMRLEVWK